MFNRIWIGTILITKRGLWSSLYACTTLEFSKTSYVLGFIEIIRKKTSELFKIKLL